ncbi:hypothetical protein LINPERPRIM_LOCUS41017 [Linum perenne]
MSLILVLMFSCIRIMLCCIG